jgi:hypothetical protein
MRCGNVFAESSREEKRITMSNDHPSNESVPGGANSSTERPRGGVAPHAGEAEGTSERQPGEANDRDAAVGPSAPDVPIGENS